MADDFLPGRVAAIPGRDFGIGGQAVTSAETVGSILRGFLIGLVGTYVVLSYQFRSYLEPVIVMLTIPPPSSVWSGGPWRWATKSVAPLLAETLTHAEPLVIDVVSGLLASTLLTLLVLPSLYAILDDLELSRLSRTK